MPEPSLITKVTSDISADVDYSPIKIVALVSVATLFAFFAGYFLGDFLLAAEVKSLVLTGVAMAMLLIFFVLQALFIKSFGKITLAVTLEIIVMFLPLAGYSSILVLTGFVVATLWIFFAHHMGRNELQNELRIDYFRVSKIVIGGSLTALALIIAVSYSAAFLRSENLSKRTFSYLVDSTMPMLEKYIESFMGALSNGVGGFIEKNINGELLKSIAGGAEIPEAVKTEAVESAKSEVKNQVSDLVKSITEEKDAITNDLYKEAKNNYNALPADGKLMVEFILIIVVFLVIKSISFAVRWIVAPIGYVVYQVLLFSGFALIRLESRSREIIVLN
ncbi:MAG: hypothetical protein A3I31_01605 [Candidatus Colwellbacteria bacterium RIFCSPLOWO2_02_FULL_44_20b]|uniref:Uncharacterized protein n=1 Tax=Candidatus Colwellbacteria bacterium RIFCSPLOWO2_02_FULL_44_20b TaxID=1797691 RepID=A0A1G1Z5D3_9BACT|nr:MAG: hypothetical protein A3I31_01605 [Candidatus Colwellbacteria bacterium RIFCSPLOWO2_02_FULL_44_20b]